MKNKIAFKKISEDEFFNSRKVWNKLLADSSSNRLFLSWEWLSGWWRVWSKKIYKAKLLIIFIYLDGELIGIAPFYTDVRRLYKFLSIKRVQFIGTSYQSISTVRSEYLNFIFKAGYQDQFFHALIDYFKKNIIYDELIFKDININYFYKSYLVELSKNHLKRIVGSDKGYRIYTKGEFENYIEKLSSNTRLKIYNRRKRLSFLGDIKVEHFGSEYKNKMFDLLNTFHEIRWGKKCFSEKSMIFHIFFLDLVCPRDCFSVLKINQKIVSIQYNLIIEGTLYNIQSGYDESLTNGISLGMLHIGYELERCFKINKIECFDLLAGKGKLTNYKKKFNGEEVQFQSVQFVKNKLLRFLYYLKDLIL